MSDTDRTPCDVMLPGKIIRRGEPMDVLLEALRERAALPVNDPDRFLSAELTCPGTREDA